MDSERPITLVLFNDEADEVRPILSAHLSTGIRVSERRSWWLWTRFTISGEHAAMQRLRVVLGRWGDEVCIRDAW